MILFNARFLTQKMTGVQRYAMEIALHLKALCPDVAYLSPRNIIQHDCAEKLKAHAFGGLKGHAWEQWDLPLFLRNKRDLLLSLGNTGPVLYPHKIVAIHDTAFLNTEWVSCQFKAAYRIMMPRLIQSSRKIITVSEFSRSELIKHLGVSEQKIEVIPNAVSEHFLALARQPAENRYGDYILGVSSLEPRKNFKSLILAFNRLQRKDLHLVIVGSREGIFQNPRLSSLVGDNPNIHFTGYVSDADLTGLYKHAKLFVFPSLYEGFGIPPLEAMACGCPAVVSNIPSLSEVCGDAAYYIDPNHVDSIQQGISALLADEALRKQFVERGARRVLNFNWKTSAEKYLALVRAIA